MNENASVNSSQGEQGNHGTKSTHETQGAHGALGTFEISVKYTQNSTWQGQIHWVDKGKKQNFRSALEMLKLMDEALANEAESNNAKW